MGKVYSFADDTAILYSSDSWENLKTVAENDLARVINWFDHHLLTINFQKTYFIPFASYENHLPSYTFLNIPGKLSKIHVKNNIKYLGITVDSHLRWDHHILQVTKTLRVMMYKFKYFSNLLPLKQLKILYHAFIESRLQYCILCWGGCSNSHLRRLEVLQKKILKIIYKKPWIYSSDLIFQESNVFDIRQLFYFNVIIYTYKNKSLLQNIAHSYDTRQKRNNYVATISVRKTIGMKCYTYLSAKFFNNLPEIYKTYFLTINSLNLFKKYLEKYIYLTDRHLIHHMINN